MNNKLNICKASFIGSVDRGLWLFICLACLVLFVNKVLFLLELGLPDFSVLQVASILLVNIFPYCALLLWVYLLLAGKSNIYLRIYVLLACAFFVAVLRVLEQGGESTHQGVDYNLVKHLMLAFVGNYKELEESLTLLIRIGFFSVFALGVLLKIFFNSNEKEMVKWRVLFLCLLFLTLSFFSPHVPSLEKAFRQNALVHLVKTSWASEDKFRVSTDFRFSVPVSGSKEVSALSVSVPVEAGQADIGLRSDITTDVALNENFYGVAKGKNIALIVLESTGANMLDVYDDPDAPKNAMPFLSSLSNKGIVIEETNAVMTSTSKSLVSILCGIEPYIGMQIFEATLGIPLDCLPKRLKQKGYETVFFQSASQYYESRDRLVSYAGIDTLVSLESLPDVDRNDMRKIGPFGLEDKALLSEHKKWLSKRNSHQPLLSVYLTLAQHHPYLKHVNKEQYQSLVDNNSRSKTSARGEYINEGSSSPYIRRFTNSLNYIDNFLGEIVKHYKDLGLYNDTVFIIVGDHGESFGRYHSPLFHNNTMYREGLWVPFIIANEELFASKVKINGQFSLLDVAPTISYLTGTGDVQGYRGRHVFAEGIQEEKVTYSACWYTHRCLSRSDKKFKYIFNFDNTEDELYDREHDFREVNNLASKNPERIQQYRKDVLAWYNDILSGYEAFYYSLDSGYKDKSSSYYHFPKEFLKKD